MGPHLTTARSLPKLKQRIRHLTDCTTQAPLKDLLDDVQIVVWTLYEHSQIHENIAVFFFNLGNQRFHSLPQSNNLGLKLELKLQYHS